MIKSLLVGVLALCAPVMAQADAQQALSTCFADSTTGKERKEFARWVFLALAAHPEIQRETTVPAQSLDEADQAMAKTFMRLTTESCASQVRAAVEQGGAPAFQEAFRVLGELAMQELMSNQAVMQQLSGFEKYIDRDKLAKAFSGN